MSAVGGCGGNEALEAQLLRAEGLVVVGKRIRGFADARWGAAGKTSNDRATTKTKTKKGGRRRPPPNR